MVKFVKVVNGKTPAPASPIRIGWGVTDSCRKHTTPFDVLTITIFSILQPASIFGPVCFNALIDCVNAPLPDVISVPLCLFSATVCFTDSFRPKFRPFFYNVFNNPSTCLPIPCPVWFSEEVATHAQSGRFLATQSALSYNSASEPP